MTENDKSFGDEITFQGDVNRPSKEEQSLGDHSTLGGVSESFVSDFTDLADSPDQEIEIVDLSGRYRTENLIGKGGMGEVLLAVDTRLDRQVAIKRILADAGSNKAAVARFLTEAKSIASLNHPNVVQIYDYGRDESGPFLIMEYVAGGSLLDRCKQGPIKLEDAVNLACQLCDGLSSAHDAGIIHRDIKPANILITSDGIPKLTDFGLAKADSRDHTITMAGAVLGTLDFMPPEQRQDSSLVDASSDQWSLAATLYQMLTGKSPKVIKLNAIPSLALQNVVGKALEDRRDDRYQSVLELRNALIDSLADARSPNAELDEGQCGSCGATNSASRKFCRQCATSLLADCCQCESSIPLWEKVCGECGCVQEEVLKQRRENLQARRLKAEEHLQDFGFDLALQIATEIHNEPDIRLGQLKLWSTEFLQNIETVRQREYSRVEELLDEASKHEAAKDFSSGIRTLEQVHKAFCNLLLPDHSETVAEVMQRLTAAQNRLELLEKQVRERVKQRQLKGLLVQVEQLLELAPNRKTFVKLRDKLIAREEELASQVAEICMEAGKLCEDGEVKAAFKLINKVKEDRLTQEQAGLKKKLSEFVAFERDLSASVRAAKAGGAIELNEIDSLLQKARLILDSLPKFSAVRRLCAELSDFQEKLICEREDQRKSLYDRIELESGSNLIEERLPSLQKYVELFPEHKEMEQHYQQLKEVWAEGKVSSDRQYDRAESLFASQKYEEALRAINQVPMEFRSSKIVLEEDKIVATIGRLAEIRAKINSKLAQGVTLSLSDLDEFLSLQHDAQFEELKNVLVGRKRNKKSGVKPFSFTAGLFLLQAFMLLVGFTIFAVSVSLGDVSWATTVYNLAWFLSSVFIGLRLPHRSLTAATLALAFCYCQIFLCLCRLLVYVNDLNYYSVGLVGLVIIPLLSSVFVIRILLSKQGRRELTLDPNFRFVPLYAAGWREKKNRDRLLVSIAFVLCLLSSWFIPDWFAPVETGSSANQRLERINNLYADLYDSGLLLSTNATSEYAERSATGYIPYSSARVSEILMVKAGQIKPSMHRIPRNLPVQYDRSDAEFGEFERSLILINDVSEKSVSGDDFIERSSANQSDFLEFRLLYLYLCQNNDSVKEAWGAYQFSHTLPSKGKHSHLIHAYQQDSLMGWAKNDLAWDLATGSKSTRNGPAAVTLAVEACEETGWRYWGFLDTLAAALAESGHFDEAVRVAKAALQLAPETEQAAVSIAITRYEAKLPPAQGGSPPDDSEERESDTNEMKEPDDSEERESDTNEMKEPDDSVLVNFDDSQMAQYQFYLNRARYSLFRRDKVRAKRSIENAQRIRDSISSEVGSEFVKGQLEVAVLVDDIVEIYDLLDGFWEQVIASSTEIPGGQELDISGQIIGLVESDQEKVIVRNAGSNITYGYSFLPPQLAVVLAKQGSIKDIPTWNKQLAAFYAVNQVGGKNYASQIDKFLKESEAAGHSCDGIRHFAGFDFDLFEQVNQKVPFPDKKAQLDGISSFRTEQEYETVTGLTSGRALMAAQALEDQLTDDVAQNVVFLEEIRKLGMRSGDSGIVDDAIREIGNLSQVNVANLWCDSYLEMADSLLSVSQRRGLMEVAIPFLKSDLGQKSKLKTREQLVQALSKLAQAYGMADAVRRLNQVEL